MDQVDYKCNDQDGNLIDVVIKKPNHETRRNARIRYSAALSAALQQGAMMKAEADKLIKDRGIWTDDNDTELQNMRRDLRKLEVDLEKHKPDENGRDLAVKISQKRGEIEEYITARSDLLNRTAERLAEDVEMEFLLQNCVHKKDGSQLFPDNDTIDKYYGTNTITDCISLLWAIMLNLDTNENEEKDPEQAWLLKHDLMDEKTGLLKDKDGRLVDVHGRLVDENGRFINEAGEHVDEFGFLVTDTESISITEKEQEKEKDSGGGESTQGESKPDTNDPETGETKGAGIPEQPDDTPAS